MQRTGVRHVRVLAQGYGSDALLLGRSEPLEEYTHLEAPEHREVMEELWLLPKDSRNIIYLYYYESYTIAEIARILGKNPNTVSSKLQRARKKLKALLTEGEDSHD